MKIINATRDEDLLSISSEAFGLLLLENYWGKWLDLYEKCGGRIGDIGRSQLTELVSTIEPKYTGRGLKNSKNNSTGTCKGWSIEGIYRFNVFIICFE